MTDQFAMRHKCINNYRCLSVTIKKQMDLFKYSPRFDIHGLTFIPVCVNSPLPIVGAVRAIYIVFGSDSSQNKTIFGIYVA